jgi:hypothetical protein
MQDDHDIIAQAVTGEEGSHGGTDEDVNTTCSAC